MDSDTGKTDLTETEQKAAQLLTEITALKGRAEGAAVAAEQARSKADSESGFAFNAKQNAEDHAKAISQVKGTVDADFTFLSTTKLNAEQAAQAIATAKGAADADVVAMTKLKAAIEQDAALAATARTAADASHTGAAKAQTEVNAALAKANEDAATLAQSKATVEASAVAVQALQATVVEGAAKAKSDGDAIATREAETKVLIQSMTEVATTANQTLTRVSSYEEELTKLKADFAALHAKTEALLPGATSAGLASAFREQKSRFDGPQKNWLATFIAAVVLLLAAGLIGLPGLHSGEANPSWDVILRHIVNRLPLVGPLVWLGIYAGRNYMLALRMQDEYAFKEAISATFEGYKREMAAIQGPVDKASPLVTLCENVLGTLAQRPGRIYEGKHEDITPLAPLTKAIGDIAVRVMDKVGNAVSKAIEDLKPGPPIK